MAPIPFAYDPERSIEVHEETKQFMIVSGLEREISKLGWACHDIGNLIPHTTQSLWSGHFFPWIESWDELQVSYNLCAFGLYKQAMISLRSGLELGLLSVYWNLNDDGHETVRKWLASGEDTPRIAEISKRLARHPNFRTFMEHYDLKSDLMQMRFLHDYTHTKGHRFSNSLGLFKSNFQTFEEQGVRAWSDAFVQVVRMLAVCHLVKYPLGTVRFDWDAKFGIDKPMFGGLDDFQVDRLEGVVGPDVFALIAGLAETDPTVQHVLSWVKDLPDLSEHEIEQQVVDWEKRRIEQMGLSQWLKEENRLVKPHERTEKWKRRVAFLTEWARREGYVKSLWEREGLPLPPCDD